MRWPRFAGFGVLVAPLIVGGAMRFDQIESPRDTRFARDTVGCLDTLHASDSISAVVTMSVRPHDRRAKLPPDFEGLFVQEFRSRLKMPANLPLGVMLGWTPCDSVRHQCAGGVLALGSKAYATAHPGGTLSRILVIDYALVPALTDTVRAILQKLSDEHSTPILAGADSILLDIFIHVEQHPDTVPAFRHLFRATIPHYSLQFSEPEWPKNARGPRYPSIAERARVTDSVDLDFTVLPDGTVAPQSVDLKAAHYTDFIRAVFDRIVTIHYIPGRIGSCPVATATGQKFIFRLP
jgi:hypothetical protein